MDASASTSGIQLEGVVRDRGSLRTLRHLALHLRRGTIADPENVSNATAKALRSVVSAARFGSLQELITIIRTSGAYLQDAQPKEQSIGNITRRILHLLREEARAAGIVDRPQQTHQPRSLSSSASVTTPVRPSLGASAASFMSSGSSSNVTSTPPASTFHSRVSSSLHSQQSLTNQVKTPPPASPGDLAFRPMLSAFRPGSTFSISDLVAASAGASSSAAPSSFATSPLGSGATTPPAWGNASIDRLGYGVENLQLHSEKQAHEGVEEENDDDDDDEEEEEEEEEEDGEGEGEVSGAQEDDGKRKRGGNAGIYQLKPLLIQAIQELIDELETVDSNIAKDARDHIHSGEVIFTIGYSRTVETFLRAAAKDRRFTVIVAETAPDFSGHKLAKLLSAANISTLLVPDSATFTLMPRISKILLGAHCILANGGLLATAGARMVAEAARAHSTPTVVLAGVYKVCPDWTWVGIGTSLVDNAGKAANSSITSFSSGFGGGSGLTGNHAAGLSSETTPLDVLAFTEAGEAEVVNAEWDYVDPDMIDLLITNVGEHPVSLVYRLLSENYDAQDLLL